MAKRRASNQPVGLVDANSDAVEDKKTHANDPHEDFGVGWVMRKILYVSENN
jgi:hypothetical protein